MPRLVVDVCTIMMGTSHMNTVNRQQVQDLLLSESLLIWRCNGGVYPLGKPCSTLVWTLHPRQRRVCGCQSKRLATVRTKLQRDTLHQCSFGNLELMKMRVRSTVGVDVVIGAVPGILQHAHADGQHVRSASVRTHLAVKQAMGRNRVDQL
jgi:hypothetical protein